MSRFVIDVLMLTITNEQRSFCRRRRDDEFESVVSKIEGDKGGRATFVLW